MEQWLDLPSRGDVVGLDGWDRYGDPSEPPDAPTPYALLLSDENNNTGAVCQNWDRTVVLGIGCAGSPLVPVALELLTGIRIHGTIGLFNVIQGTNHRMYALIKRGDGSTLAELFVPLSATFVPVAFDFGWLTGLSIPGQGGTNAVNGLKVEISCNSADTPEGSATLIVTEWLYDYEGNPPAERSVMGFARTGHVAGFASTPDVEGHARTGHARGDGP